MANIFTGILDLDNTPPALSNIFPAPLSADVPVSTNISFTITDTGTGVDLNSIDVVISSIPAIVNGIFGPGFSGTITAVSGGFDITIDPVTSLAYGANVSVEVYAQDLAGIFNFVSQTWQFSTEQDTTPPQLDNALPPDGATDVARSSTIFFDITDPESGVSLGSLNLEIAGEPAIVNGVIQLGFSGSATPISSGYTIAITPDSIFPSYSEIALSLAVQNNIELESSYSWSFTTADEDAPEFILSNPAAGQVDVAQNTSISFTVTDAADIDTASLNVSIEGLPAIVAGVVQSGFNGSVSKTTEITYTQLDVELTPDVQFSSYQTVNVYAEVADVSANTATASWEFRTVDSEEPLITNPLPADGSVDVPPNTVAFIQIIDSQSGVDFSTINATVQGEPAIINGVYQLGYLGSIDPIVDGYEVHVHPQSDYASFSLVQIDISASDLSGNPAAFSWSFRISDIQQPTISNLQPPPGTDDVPVSTQISFDVKDFESGVDTSAINLEVHGDDAILAGIVQPGFSGTILPIVDGYSISVAPIVYFPGATVITASAEVYDIAGNVTSVSWDFTTEILISYIMRAYRAASSSYVYWSYSSPDELAEHAPYPPEELTDVVIASIVDGGEKTYGMRAYYTVSEQYVYWLSVGEPDELGALAPAPPEDLTDIAVTSFWISA